MFGLSGTVYLVGAGPGAADLLTRRAASLLAQADVVLHDELVSQEVLDVARKSALILNVGKRCGRKNITQEQINEKMIQFARQGQTVVRLKGGDPLIFGRAQEEMQALREAGISFEIVPGITAALAAAAAAKIPLTERRSASKLLFVSNHQADPAVLSNWRSNVVTDTTLVFYMPGHDFAELVRELQGGGLEAETPCLIISNVSRPEQQFFRTALRELAAAPTLASPSLLVVGSMVSEFADGKVTGNDQLDEILLLKEDAGESSVPVEGRLSLQGDELQTVEEPHFSS